MQEAPCVWAGVRRSRLGEREPEERSRKREPRRRQPDRVVPVVSEHDLAQERTDREARPEAERVDADRLAATLLGSDVGDDRRGAHEDERLADSGHEAERHEEGERARDRVRSDGARDDERPGDHQDPPSASVPDAAGDRLEEDRGRAQSSDGEPDPDRSRLQRALRVERQRAEEHADREADSELREHGEDERPREQAVHRPIQPERG